MKGRANVYKQIITRKKTAAWQILVEKFLSLLSKKNFYALLNCVEATN